MRRLAMTLSLIAIAVLIAAVANAGAATQPPDKVFRKALMVDPAVSDSVKELLQAGGFVQKDVQFTDLTGEGKADAIVSVNSGGIAGVVATYVLSAGTAQKLKVVFAAENKYRQSARSSGAELILRSPEYAAGDSPCCASKYVERHYRWDTHKLKFRQVSRVRIKS